MIEKKTTKHFRKTHFDGTPPKNPMQEFVREEIHHIRLDQNGTFSTMQASTSLSKERRTGVLLKSSKKGKVSKKSQKSATSAYAKEKKSVSKIRSIK